MPSILAFAGSARKDSVNKKLLAAAVESARAAGGDVIHIDLRDYPMPLYDGDLEDQKGPPENAIKVCDLMKSHDAFLLSCPEYNSAITPLLKNTIDWVSRPREGDPPLAAFKGKVAALLSASPGALGGIRGLVHVRSILGNIGVIVLPNQLALPKAHEAFAPDGALTDPKLAERIATLTAELVDAAAKLHP